MPPQGDWQFWSYIAGRGAGKTRTGAEWVRSKVEAGYKRGALVAPTNDDFHKVMVMGESGILACCPPWDLPEYNENKKSLTWKNGSQVFGYSAEKPARLRGPQHDFAWCFIAGTIVETDLGPMPIEQVDTARKVMTRKGLKRVVSTSSRVANTGKVTFDNGAELVGTLEHPVYTSHGWTRMSDLKAGDVGCAIDVLSGAETFAVRVASTWQPAGEQPVYCLKVDDQPEYFANGILVHNCDEIAAWHGKKEKKPGEVSRRQETWDMLMFGLRLGDNPQCFVSTTPLPVDVIRELIEKGLDDGNDAYAITRGSTYANRVNLAEKFFAQIITKYEGTRLGKQELEGELLLDVPGSLWTFEMISQTRQWKRDGKKLPDMRRIVVAVDPSGASGASDEKADEIGIVVAGEGVDGDYYIIEDATMRGSPRQWAGAAVNACYRHKADYIVAEQNFGGEMVRATIEGVTRNVRVNLVTASRGKVVRAEPVSLLYEKNRVHHAEEFPHLEDQMVKMTPSGFIGDASPDRLDAMVWGVSELSQGASDFEIIGVM